MTMGRIVALVVGSALLAAHQLQAQSLGDVRKLIPKSAAQVELPRIQRTDFYAFKSADDLCAAIRADAIVQEASRLGEYLRWDAAALHDMSAFVAQHYGKIQSSSLEVKQEFRDRYPSAFIRPVALLYGLPSSCVAQLVKESESTMLGFPFLTGSEDLYARDVGPEEFAAHLSTIRGEPQRSRPTTIRGAAPRPRPSTTGYGELARVSLVVGTYSLPGGAKVVRTLLSGAIARGKAQQASAEETLSQTSRLWQEAFTGVQEAFAKVEATALSKPSIGKSLAQCRVSQEASYRTFLGGTRAELGTLSPQEQEVTGDAALWARVACVYQLFLSTTPLPPEVRGVAVTSVYRCAKPNTPYNLSTFGCATDRLAKAQGYLESADDGALGLAARRLANPTPWDLMFSEFLDAFALPLSTVGRELVFKSVLVQ